MKRTLFALAVVLLAASPALAQTNPCTTPTANAIIGGTGTNHFWAELPEQTATLPDGTPVVASYQFGVWPDGTTNLETTPPAQGPTTIPKTAFMPVPGFANCYELVGGLPGLIPQQARMVASMRAMSQPGAPTPSSGWGAPSNSFSLASVRVTPAAPGRMRVTP